VVGGVSSFAAGIADRYWFTADETFPVGVQVGADLLLPGQLPHEQIFPEDRLSTQPISEALFTLGKRPSSHCDRRIASQA